MRAPSPAAAAPGWRSRAAAGGRSPSCCSGVSARRGWPGLSRHRAGRCRPGTAAPGPAEHPLVCAVPEGSTFCRGVGLKFGGGGSAPTLAGASLWEGVSGHPLPAGRDAAGIALPRGSPSRASSESVPAGQRGRAQPQSRRSPSASRPHRRGEPPNRAPSPQGKPSQTSGISQALTS